ncbi:MAG: hypothetical protein PVH17_06545 [Anaerolineae bacterium]|jgi:hypothetical protein
MSTEYPDVLGNLVEARHRFEVNGVHYLTALEPQTIAPGETTALCVWLQSCWDVAAEVSISVHLPAQPAHAFSVIQKTTDVPLEAAEVGKVTIPIACETETKPGQYSVLVTIDAQPETRGLYVRSQETQDRFGDSLLNLTTGTALATTVGLGFVVHTQPEQTFSLHVEGAPRVAPERDLTPTYFSRWTVNDLPIQGKAQQHVNDRRLYILPQLTREALFKAFLEESQERLRQATLPLHIGEAIFLARILTHTAEYFLKRPDWQDVVLVPAYMLAYRYDLPTNDPILLVVRADYARMARLAISLSFGSLHRRLKRDLWTMEEQLGVADLVTDRVERGGVLPAEFLYLPLLLGGLIVADQVQMPGENLSQSLTLLAEAQEKRSDELAENPELVALFDRLLQLTRSAS